MKKVTNFFNALVQKYLPDPFVLGVFLIVTVAVCALAFTPTSPVELMQYFGSGFWGLLSFSMQLSFVIITASAIANTPSVKRFVRMCARVPKTPAQAAFAVALITSLVGLINWGVALVVGVIYAKEVAKQVRGAHFPLLIAASYIGFTLWSSGISSSIPLTLNTPGHALEQTVGLLPLTQTIFSPYNLIITVALLFTYALVSRAMTPDAANTVQIDLSALEDKEIAEPPVPESGKTLAYRLENSRLISSFAGAICLVYFVYSLVQGGINSINLNSINMLTLGVGLLMYRGVVSYLRATTSSIKSVVPIMILYPFYSAISAMITSSGLGVMMTDYFASIATKTTLPLLTYLAAGLLNLFVPAAGGQWIIQGPVFVPLADQFGLSKGLISMAITYGDTWTNLLQPFWALPALALAKLGIRDIMGYCIIAMLVSGVVTGVLLTVLPLFL